MTMIINGLITAILVFAMVPTIDGAIEPAGATRSFY